MSAEESAGTLAREQGASHNTWDILADQIDTIRRSLLDLQQPIMSAKKVALGLLLSVSASANIDSGDEKINVPDFTTAEAGNPFIEGWYADPYTGYYNNEYWLFPTWSDVYEQQTHLDAFSSPDLVKWMKHSNIITTGEVLWAHKAMWAPAHIERN